MKTTLQFSTEYLHLYFFFFFFCEFGRARGFPVNSRTNVETFSTFAVRAVFISQRLIAEQSIEPIEQSKQ